MAYCPEYETNRQISKSLLLPNSCLEGKVTIGNKTLVCSKASIVAKAGPIVIKENNVIAEGSIIINENDAPLHIGINNLFAEGSEIHAASVGDYNIFEPNCYVGCGVEIGSGCIISEGCKITFPQKIPDFSTVSSLPNLGIKNSNSSSENLSRQNDEILALNEIICNEDFKHSTLGDISVLIFNIKVSLPENFVVTLSKSTAKESSEIIHLPPIYLTATLTEGYPSCYPPDFILVCCWLSKRQLTQLSEKLFNLWEENQCEIFYTWYLFLQDETFEFLKLSSNYETINKFKFDEERVIRIFEEPGNQDTGNQVKRISYSELLEINNDFECPGQIFEARANIIKMSVRNLKLYYAKSESKYYFFLVENNVSEEKKAFKKEMHTCNVCFSDQFGTHCRLLACGHITCLNCLHRMCEVHIKEGSVESIICPEHECNGEIPVHLIKELVSKELFEKYDNILLIRGIESMPDKVFCPISNCQYPVVDIGDDNLATCPICLHSFCKFCKRTYHGIEPCKLGLSADDKKQLVEIYQKGSITEKKDLEKKYGKRQLLHLVNSAMSEIWMLQNSKKCPCCDTRIEKNDGCNKMICVKCKTRFCWLCLDRLPASNPYLHYQSPKSPCNSRLFDGTTLEFIPDEEEFEEGNEIFDPDQIEFEQFEEGNEIFDPDQIEFEQFEEGNEIFDPDQIEFEQFEEGNEIFDPDQIGFEQFEEGNEIFE